MTDGRPEPKDAEDPPREPEEAAPQPRWSQRVSAVGGYAYGVIGADLHVFGDGSPLYLLENWGDAATPDADWLRELPSRMLNARHAVVPFTGRDDELVALRRWRDDRPRLAVRWLYGPGGQGKTRLAAQLAVESQRAGWRVVQAVHGLGTVLPSPSSQDLTVDGRVGVLLVVDYADRWPPTHLTWLFSNALLHQPGVPTRILLLARSDTGWPAVRAALANHMASTTSHHLPALPDEPRVRAAMFDAARDSFADRYDIGDPTVIACPRPLSGPDMGLVLAVHIAALVAVDAHTRGRPTPRDAAGLTSYLLDREHLHWVNLHAAGDGHSPSTIRTEPELMNRMVFVAALTGNTTETTGVEVVDRLGLPVPSQRLLADHRVCYPPAAAGQATVLEPLYPDRLAEDFLALTLPGHGEDYPARPWAGELLDRLCAGDTIAVGASPARAVTFLAAAAQRWPHVGSAHLYPLLRRDPTLLLAAGSAAMTTLTEAADLDVEVLRAVERLLPTERDVDLDTGAAAITARLTEHRLATATDPGRRGQLRGLHGWRLANAGHHEAALAATLAAVEEYRTAARDDPSVYRPLLAAALNNVCVLRSELGRQREGRPEIEEAVALRRQLATDDPAYLPGLAIALNNLGLLLSELGYEREAVAPTDEALRIRRRLVDADRTLLPDLASSLTNAGLLRVKLGDLEAALEFVRQAGEHYRELADAQPATHLPHLAAALNNLGSRYAELGRIPEALDAFAEAVDLRRDLVRRNETAFLPALAAALNNYGNALARADRGTDALVVTREAAGIYRRLAAANPQAYLPTLASILRNLGSRESEAGAVAAALDATTEAVAIRRRLSADDPPRYADDLAHALLGYAEVRARIGTDLARARATVDEAVEILRGRDAESRGGAARILAHAQQVRETVLAALNRSPAASGPSSGTAPATDLGRPPSSPVGAPTPPPAAD
ncbi:tetratricopeptide repeat protein [Micromonospora sp. NPDC048830]|uniref:tetratricopeptide repeat protein n=1 Tax=Micromonospora sp. NPDC048830 TaxID=3364257 RepID=UPI00372319FC